MGRTGGDGGPAERAPWDRVHAGVNVACGGQGSDRVAEQEGAREAGSGSSPRPGRRQDPDGEEAWKELDLNKGHIMV